MRRLALIFAVLLGSSAGAAETTVPLGPDPVMAGGVFSRGGGGVTVAAEVREAADGRMAVCGVWARSARLSVYARDGARDTLVPATIRVDGQLVRRDLRVFPRVPAADSYTGAPARCVATGLAWRPDATLEISVPRQIVHESRGGGDGGFELVLNRSSLTNPALLPGSFLPPSVTDFLGMGS